MSQLHLFAGGNTSRGFFSCFADILPAQEQKRMFYIKGGPGVGKSTLMRRVAEAAEQKGLKVEYYHCSSDPDSLDGISLPERGLAMMDGTSPHVYDPVIPGARDTLLSLGDYLQEGEMRSHAQEIDRIQRAISQRFQRCYSFLSAAGELSRLCGTGEVKRKATQEQVEKWTELLPLRGGEGRIRSLFGSAYTPKGLVQFLPAEGFRTYYAECPAGLHLTEMWHSLSSAASQRGLPVVVLLNPLLPSQVDGVLLPAQGMLFHVCAPETRTEAVPAERLFQLSDSGEQERSFDHNACELMQQRALEQLKAAKALHDELEAHYVGHMDFLGWQKKLDQVLAEV